jgi:hypothetical protein
MPSEYGFTSSGDSYKGRRTQSAAQYAAGDQYQAGREGRAEGSMAGMQSGALQGAQYGATAGMLFGPIGAGIGLVGGAIIGAGIGAATGGAKGEKEAVAAEKQAQTDKRRSDILARQTKTAMQQEAKAASGAKASSAKAPPMAPVSGMDAAMQAMPATTGKGTAYDAWRSTVYGG